MLINAGRPGARRDGFPWFARAIGRGVNSLAATLLLLLLLVGCSQKTALESRKAAFQDSWDSLYIKGEKIGHVHTRIQALRVNGAPATRVENENVMKVKRFQQATVQRVTLLSIEDDNGQLLSCETVLELGPQKIVTRGSVAQGELKLETTTAGKISAESRTWDASWGGYFAPDLSLLKKPMKAGETRRLKALIPIFNQVAEIVLTARRNEATQLLGETRNLLRIDNVTRLQGRELESTIWTDDKGRVIKAHTPVLEQTSYRTTQAKAFEESGAGQFDLGESTMVPVARRLTRPHATQQVVYRAKIEGKDPSQVFVQGATQSLKKRSDGEFDLVVRAVRPDQPPRLETPELPPAEGDLEPNNLIQSDNPAVVRMARQVVPEEKDAWKVAVALEKHVDQVIQEKDFSQAFATAAEVVESLQGDCTEHSVLLAALCRARGIPARVAMGLVYYERGNRGAFAYHMWTEAWIKDRWIPLDGTRGEGGIGAAHIKLSHSNLKGADAYAAFLPVYDVLGRLQLEIVSVR